MPDGAGERDDEEEQRERHHDLGHARDDRVDPAAEEAGERAQERRRSIIDEERRADRDLERDLRAVEEPQELVTAELAVGAEDEQRRGLVPDAPAYGAVETCVHGPDGRSRRRVDVLVDASAKMSFGPCPRKWAAMGAPTKATRIEQDDEDAAGDGDACRLRSRRQTCSQ